jgi:hypothetical protein
MEDKPLEIEVEQIWVVILGAIVFMALLSSL